MAQMERMQRKMETRTTPNTPTVEQLLNEDSQWSAPATPSSPFGFHGDHPKKSSVLAKVKERTKRWRDSLASKKKNVHNDNATPTWGVSLEEDDDDDDQEEEGDPEYLGAPMYESEMAPEACKETARQHPRANPVISDKHALPTSDTTHDKENDPAAKNKTITQTVTDKFAPACAMVTATLAPAYTTVSEATHQITSKIQGQADSPSSNTAGNTHTGSVASTGTGTGNGAREQRWDKGVSVKEYVMNKLEPGEDERALSQVITEAISPRKRATGGDNRDWGVVEKVRETVSSLLWTPNDSSPSGSTTTTTTTTTKPANTESTNIPISTNAYSAVGEVEEEKNEGRILQAN